MNIKKLITLYLTDYTAFDSYVESIDKAISGVTVAQHVNQNEAIRLLQPKYIQQLENQFKSLVKFQNFNITAMDILRENFFDPTKNPNSKDARSIRKEKILKYFVAIEFAASCEEGATGALPLGRWVKHCSPEAVDALSLALVEIYEAAGFQGTVQGDRNHEKLRESVASCDHDSTFLKQVRDLAWKHRKNAIELRRRAS